MADRFLREVKRMHQLRQDINEMTSFNEALEPHRGEPAEPLVPNQANRYARRDRRGRRLRVARSRVRLSRPLTPLP